MTLESLKNVGIMDEVVARSSIPNQLEAFSRLPIGIWISIFLNLFFFALPGFSAVFKRNVIGIVWGQLEKQTVYLATVLEY